VPKSTFTQITVFDMLGRQIESLINDNLSAGTYDVSWDSAKYSSGEYFYRIVTSDFVETKRMSLVK